MTFEYVGSELELFASAKNWRAYWTSLVRSHLGQRVLEVGAGIGSATRQLIDDKKDWVALEPDKKMAEQMRHDRYLSSAKVLCGTIDSIDKAEKFDNVLYLDVLEHIENDVLEIEKACHHLKPGGSIVILSPAHNWLMSEFDMAVGHHRRYSKGSLEAIRPKNMLPVAKLYLDSFGLFASLGNKLILRQASPNKSQIMFWDSFLVPVSKVLDRILLYSIGKSVLVVWRKEN